MSPLQVPCETCAANPGQACREIRGAAQVWFHPLRVELAKARTRNAKRMEAPGILMRAVGGGAVGLSVACAVAVVWTEYRWQFALTAVLAFFVGAAILGDPK